MLRASSSTTRVGAGCANTSPDKQPLSHQDFRNMFYLVDTSVEDTLSTYTSADSVGSFSLPSLASADSAGSMGPLFKLLSPDYYRSLDAVVEGLIASDSSSDAEQSFLVGGMDFSPVGGLSPAEEHCQPTRLPTSPCSSMDWMLPGGRKDIECSPRMFDTADATLTPVSSEGKRFVDDYEKKLAPKPSSVSPPVVEASKKEARKPAPKKTVAAKHKSATKKSSSTKKSTSRCVEPMKKIYCVPTERDILCGRGDGPNNHPGNKYYRAKVNEEKPAYLKSPLKEKTSISKQIVDQMYKDIEGPRRFLKEDKTIGQWYEITYEAARTKASQALREENTKESREAKRELYQNKK